MAQIKMQYGSSGDRTIKKYLYKEGDERINITGGWGTYGTTYYANSRTMTLELGTKNTDNLYTGGSTSTTAKGFSPQNKIDFTGYKYLCVDCYRSNVINVYDCMIRINATSRAFTESDVVFNDFPLTREVKKYDITRYQSDYYMILVSDSSPSRFGYIYNIWLEK